MGDNEAALSSLYPALVECFTIILLGYVSGRAYWITASQAEGLNKFTGLFALPALLFCSLATLNWSMVEWTFLIAILISKAALFFVVLFSSMILQRPCNIGASGLYAVFATQSNDFALGFPIVSAIYAKSEPEFVQYIYLLAPISLLILNPIAFTLLEIQKASAQSQRQSKVMLVLKIIKQIFTNPIIVSTLLGFVTNFICGGNLPLVIKQLLDTLAQAFSAPALFMLGLSAVGKFSNSQPSLLLGSSLLICAKLLVLPMIAMGMTTALHCGASTNSSADYSMFAFLYGTIPTAPSVFIYSTHYAVAVDMIATSSVIVTVVSAPLMFITATVVGIQMFALEESILTQISMDVAIVSIIFSVGLLLLFALTKRGRRIPYLMIVVLIIYQVLLSAGALANSAVSPRSCSLSVMWWEYLIYISHTLGTIGVATMTCVTAFTLYIISCQSFSNALQYKRWLLLYGLGAPVVLTAVTMFSSGVQPVQCTGRTMFTSTQMAIVFSLLAIHMIATICLLILRHRRTNHPLSPADIDINNTGCNGATSPDASSTKSYGTLCSTKSEPFSVGENRPLVPDIESVSVAGTSEETALISTNCAACPVEGCGELSERSDSNVDISTLKFGRILVLLVLLIVCHIVALFYFLWLLIDSEHLSSGQLVEVEFLYIVAETGQGFFTFLIFGLDSEMVLAPVTRLFKKMVAKIRGGERQDSTLPDGTVHICTQFVDHHLQHCLESLQRIPGSKKGCFHGAAFSAWLIDAGLAPDHSEAQIYAEHLLLGKIIKSCSKRDTDTLVDSKRSLYTFGMSSDYKITSVEKP